MINHTIESEDSSIHWPYFNTLNHNVLDLGCGRWYTTKVEELSPLFFGNTANSVVEVDYNENDIKFYKDQTKDDPKYTFYSSNISSSDQVKELIKLHSITALKCDIEGGEIVLLDLTYDDLKNISELAIEFHSDVLKKAFMKKVIEWGFNIKAVANFARTPDYMGVIFCSK